MLRFFSVNHLYFIVYVFDRQKKTINNEIWQFFSYSIAVIGILSTIQLILALQPSQKYSLTIIHALENVLDRSYGKSTSTVFITVESSLTKSNGPSPYEMAGDVMRLNSERITMAYVMGNKIPARYSRSPRIHNVFIVDSYESFR